MVRDSGVLANRIEWLQEQVVAFESNGAANQAEVMRRWLDESESQLAVCSSAHSRNHPLRSATTTTH